MIPPIVYPSLTVKRSITTIKISMPWPCLYLALPPLWFQNYICSPQNLVEVDIRLFLYIIKEKSHHYHVSVIQYAGLDGNSHVVMHLNIYHNHTLYLWLKTVFAGKFGLWQGSLNTVNSDAHNVTLDYHTPVSATNTVSSDLEWKPLAIQLYVVHISIAQKVIYMQVLP